MRTDVTFRSNGMRLAAHLWTPDGGAGAAEGTRLPAVVVGHPTTGVKEQTATLYARRLAGQGYVTLAFDAAYQGESEGEPRGLENPFQRADDFREAVTYLTTRDDVDPERIGVLGICGSGGYVPYAAQTDHRMKAVATVSAADVPSFFRDADPEGFQRMVARAGELRSAEARGEPATLVNAVPHEIDASTPAPVREFHDYYRTPRAQHPRSTNEWVLRSVDERAQYDSYANIGMLAPRPLLMIAGGEAFTRYFSEDAVARAGDSAELFTVEGATHVDLYDRDEAVTPAVDKLTAFFGTHL